MPVAFKLGTALGVFLLPAARLRLLPADAAAVPRARSSAPRPPSSSSTSRTTRSGAARSRARSPASSRTPTASASPSSSSASSCRARADGRGPWAAGRRPRPHRATPTATPCSGRASPPRASSSAIPRPGRAARRAWPALGWLLAVAALAFALAGPLLVPLLADWGWTTPYDDAWIDRHDPRLLPAAPVAAPPRRRRRRSRRPSPGRGRPAGRPDGRLLLLGFGALAGAALASAGPALGVIDVRFVPLAQLSLALAGAAGLGLAPRPARPRRRGGARPRPARRRARGLLARASCATGSTGTTRASRRRSCGRPGRQLTERLRGGPGDPRVAFEYGPVHERAGSIRMHETVPFFSGRSGIEGVYNQSSMTTHPVYYLAVGALPLLAEPVPQPDLLALRPGDARSPACASSNVGHVVAVTRDARLRPRRARRRSCARRGSRPTRSTASPARGPATSSPSPSPPCARRPRAGATRSFHWFSRKPPNRAVLVFTDDPRFDVVASRRLGPASRASRCAGGVEVTARRSRPRRSASRRAGPATRCS